MCRECIFTIRPNRQTTTLEAGCYLINFKACFECQERNIPSSSEKFGPFDSNSWIDKFRKKEIEKASNSTVFHLFILFIRRQLYILFPHDRKTFLLIFSSRRTSRVPHGLLALR